MSDGVIMERELVCRLLGQRHQQALWRRAGPERRGFRRRPGKGERAGRRQRRGQVDTA
jgi:hypothetical protein